MSAPLLYTAESLDGYAERAAAVTYEAATPESWVGAYIACAIFRVGAAIVERMDRENAELNAIREEPEAVSANDRFCHLCLREPNYAEGDSPLLICADCDREICDRCADVDVDQVGDPLRAKVTARCKGGCQTLPEAVETLAVTP